MSEIAPLNASEVSRTGAINASFARDHEVPTPASDVRRGADHVEFSEVATYLSKLRQLPIREDLISRVRDEIARGVYDTPEKLDAAIDELISDL